MSKRGRSWTNQEEDFLRDNFLTMTPKEMSPLLQRTSAAIKTHLRKLGITQQGVTFDCRFCGDQVCGTKKDLSRGCCQKQECLVKNKQERWLIYGQERGWQAQKEWNSNNREKLNELQRVENLTEEQHKSRKNHWNSYYAKNQTARCAYQAERRKRNPEVTKGQYKKLNDKYVTSYSQVLRFAKANDLKTKEAGEVLAKHLKDRCAICGRRKDEIPNVGNNGYQGLHLDHIDGNSQNYDIDNLQHLCWRCNQVKRDLPLCEESSKAIKILTDLYYNHLNKGRRFKCSSSEMHRDRLQQ